MRGYSDAETAEAHREIVRKQIRKNRTRKQSKAIRFVLLQFHRTALLTRREVADLTKQLAKALEGIDL